MTKSQYPEPHIFQKEDGSVIIEYIWKDFRIGINIELDPTESGWHIVSRNEPWVTGYILNDEAKEMLKRNLQRHDTA